MLKFLIRLCILTIGLCYATPSCHDLQKSQLASLNDRITQMLSSLHTPPQPSTTPSESSSNATPANEYTGNPYETNYYPYHPAYAVPAPQVIYVSPSHVTSHPFSYAPPPKPSVAIAPTATTSPYHHLESPGLPLDPYRGFPAIAPKPPLSHYYDHYPYPHSLQYSSPPTASYAPTSYPSPYPYSWEYSSPYPEYRLPTTYLHPPPTYAHAPPPLPPSYQPAPGYLPPNPYLPPPYYSKQPDIPPPAYYA